MIKEGDIIKVKVIKIIPDFRGDDSYIVESNNRKFILNKKQFKTQSITINQTIECFVDKVNCSGKIFLEPIINKILTNQSHPFYVENSRVVYDSLNVKKHLINLKNSAFGTGDILTYSETTASTINCIIRDTYKSKLILDYDTIESTSYKHNQILEVDIVAHQQLVELGPCYIVEDRTKRMHIIPQLKYSHYGLEVGNQILCKILGFDKHYNLKLEPENPSYKIGETYKFPCQRMEQSYDHFENKFSILYVIDSLGMEASIVQLPTNYQMKEYVHARVYRINNGRLYLEYME